jgi:hypothetical protein
MTFHKIQILYGEGLLAPNERIIPCWLSFSCLFNMFTVALYKWNTLNYVFPPKKLCSQDSELLFTYAECMKKFRRPLDMVTCTETIKSYEYI